MIVSYLYLKVLIEEYPVEQISMCVTILDDAMFENLLVFCTKLSKDKVGAVHLFQCGPNEVSSLSSSYVSWRWFNKLLFMQ